MEQQLVDRKAQPNGAVPLGEMLFGYLIGPFGALLSYGIFTSILQNYLTDVLRMDLSFLAGLQLMSTVLIVAANLVVGQLIERTRSLWGKARPWILLSALLLSVASLLMFVAPGPQTARYVWIAVAYNMYYSLAYPIYNTANSALVSLSTRNSQERSKLASFTNIAQLGTMGVGSMLFPMLVSFALKDDQRLWFLAMLGVAVFGMLTMLLQFRFTRERITEDNRAKEDSGGSGQSGPSLKAQLRAVTSERWWWVIIVFYLLFQFAGAMKNSSMSYFCKWLIDGSFLSGADAWGVAQSLLGALGAIPMAIAALFVVPLCNRFGKRNVVFAGMVVGAAGGIIAGCAGGNIVGVAIGVAIKCLGSAPACFMILAMLADVIDHIEGERGVRTDGLTMSIYSSIMVAATPVCNAVFSSLLALSGYDQTLAVGVDAQSASAQVAIGASYIWVETIAYAVCGVLILFWNVERSRRK